MEILWCNLAVMICWKNVHKFHEYNLCLLAFLFHLRLICRNHFVRLLEIGCRAIAFGGRERVMGSRWVVNIFKPFSSDNVDRRSGWSRGEKHKKIVYDFYMQISGQLSCCSDECTPACTHSWLAHCGQWGCWQTEAAKTVFFLERHCWQEQWRLIESRKAIYALV